MTEIKEKFPEFKTLDNTELEIVLKLYEDHFNTPFIISNPAYYVSGAMILLVSFMFVNAQSLSNPKIEQIGLTNAQMDEILPQSVPNSPQKVIMITILASSVSGLGYISLRTFFNSFAQGNNYGCFYISNAMLSGTISVAACCDEIEVWHAIIISFVACVLYSVGNKLLIKAELDDPTESFLIYGVQGFWGSLATGIFHRHKGVLHTGNGT